MKHFVCVAVVLLVSVGCIQAAEVPFVELKGHTGTTRSVGFLPGGKKIVSASMDDTARIWNGESGEELLKKDNFQRRILAFTPDGKKIITDFLTYRNFAIRCTRIWDIESNKELHLDGKFRELSADGKRVVTDSVAERDPKTVQIWDVESGKELQKLELGYVEAAQFSPSGTNIVTSSVTHPEFRPDGTKNTNSHRRSDVQIWDIESGMELHRVEGGNYRFSSDRTKIALAHDTAYAIDKDETRVFDADSGMELCKLVGHRSIFSLDGKTIATMSKDKTIRVYDAESGKELYKMETTGDRFRFFDGKRIVVIQLVRQGAERPHTTQVLDAASGKKLNLAEEFVDCSRDGKKVITNRGYVVKIWDTESGKELFEAKWSSNRYWDPPKFSPNEKNIFINQESGSWCWSESNPVCTCTTECGFSYIPRIWNVTSGRELEWDKLGGFSGFTPDGAKFIMNSGYQTRIYDSESAEELYKLKGKFHRFSPNGTKFVTTNSDHTIRIWTLE